MLWGCCMFEPKNEQGTIVYFQQVCAQLGYEIISIQTGYPDAIVRDIKREVDLRVEFEYDSNNFKTHKHDPKGADLVVCWKRGSYILDLPILELSSLVSYPPYLPFEPYAPANEPSKDRRPNVHYPKIKTLLITYKLHVHVQVRVDDSLARVILLDTTGRHGDIVEAKWDDTSRSGRLIWDVVERAKIISARLGSKEKVCDDPDARELGRDVITALCLRAQEGTPYTYD